MPIDQSLLLNFPENYYDINMESIAQDLVAKATKTGAKVRLPTVDMDIVFLFENVILDGATLILTILDKDDVVIDTYDATAEVVDDTSLLKVKYLHRFTEDNDLSTVDEYNLKADLVGGTTPLFLINSAFFSEKTNIG